MVVCVWGGAIGWLLLRCFSWLRPSATRCLLDHTPPKLAALIEQVGSIATNHAADVEALVGELLPIADDYVASLAAAVDTRPPSPPRHQLGQLGG